MVPTAPSLATISSRIFPRGGAVISFNLGEATATTREGGRSAVLRESANSHCRHDRRARARLSSAALCLLHSVCTAQSPFSSHPFLPNPTAVVNRRNEGRKNGQGGSPILLGWDLARLSHIFSPRLFGSFKFKLSTLFPHLQSTL